MKATFFLLLMIIFASAGMALDQNATPPAQGTAKAQEAAYRSAQKKELDDYVANRAKADNFFGERIYRDVPRNLKCSEYDYRMFTLCIRADFFDPSARVYFDTGSDEEGEVDLFHDGSLSPTLEFASVSVPWRLGRAPHFDRWSWGPSAGLGVSAPAGDSDDESEGSDAPVVMLSVGLNMRYDFGEAGGSFIVEIGRAFGWSASETFGDRDDSATYVGVRVKLPSTGGKKKPATE